MKLKPVLVIQGEKGIDVVPRLDELSVQAELRFASTTAELRSALPGAEVLLGWNFRAGLQEVWESASDLRWIHWAGAGVDAVVFTELVASDVQLTFVARPIRSHCC